MQPSHCTSDMRWIDKRIGKNRLSRISRWKSFIDLGIPIPGGSDCPIEDGEPLFEYYAAVTRQNHSGWPEGGWQPQEKIDRLNALKMFTTWAAFGEFSEHRRGLIKEGYDADFTIYDNDITTCSPPEILNSKLIATIVNGTFVYNPNKL
jgi:predicted amidohydrolase YtcJ